MMTPKELNISMTDILLFRYIQQMQFANIKIGQDDKDLGVTLRAPEILDKQLLSDSGEGVIFAPLSYICSS